MNMNRDLFFSYLLAKGVITEDAHELLAGCRPSAREPIGMIAVQHGLIRGGQIDRVLDAQRTSKLRFGELAVQMRLLSRDQVDRLLQVQDIRVVTDLVESLVLAGVLETGQVLQHLAGFLQQVGEADPQVESSHCLTPR